MAQGSGGRAAGGVWPDAPAAATLALLPGRPADPLGVPMSRPPEWPLVIFGPGSQIPGVPPALENLAVHPLRSGASALGREDSQPFAAARSQPGALP